MIPAQIPTVMFVTGSVTPADPSFAALLKALGGDVHPILKDLEVYATDAPPGDYSLQLEADGIGRAADAAGAHRFHLVGYSGGGACCLAYIAQHPERVLSLALIEPAWIGAIGGQDQGIWQEMGRAISLPPAQQMEAFVRSHMRPGVDPPKLPAPAGAPPPWMAKRPAGLLALWQTFNAYQLDQARFKLFKGPVYYAFGSLSTRYFEHQAETLGKLFPDFQVEEYDGRSHFDPPHRAEPERFANALKALWERAGQG